MTRLLLAMAMITLFIWPAHSTGIQEFCHIELKSGGQKDAMNFVRGLNKVMIFSGPGGDSWDRDFCPSTEEMERKLLDSVMTKARITYVSYSACGSITPITRVGPFGSYIYYSCMLASGDAGVDVYVSINGNEHLVASDVMACSDVPDWLKPSGC